MHRSPFHRLDLLALAALLLVSGCASGLYDLPDPPPREEWHRSTLSPGEDQQRAVENFIAAQRTVLGFVDALRESRWEDAYNALSNETRILLDDLSPTGRGEDALSEGVLAREESQYRFDALDLFVISDLQELTDERAGETESETYRHKEIWAVAGDGQAHRVVLILEGDSWRIHKPSIDLTPGAPGRRSPES